MTSTSTGEFVVHQLPTYVDKLRSAPYPSPNSLLNLFIENVRAVLRYLCMYLDTVPYQAAPAALAINNSRASIPNLMITNSGSQRFDLYAGPFTKNDQLTVSPFSDSFLFLSNVTLSDAKKILPALNGISGTSRRGLPELEEREKIFYEKGHVDKRYMEWLEEMDRRGVEKRAAQNLTLGYVTQDVSFTSFHAVKTFKKYKIIQSCPGVGDDVLHAPLPFNPIPNFIGSKPPNVSDATPIDLVFVDFIESELLSILNKVQSAKNYTSTNVQTYSPILANAVLGYYAQTAWN